jgi:hypothetical protein
MTTGTLCAVLAAAACAAISPAAATDAPVPWLMAGGREHWLDRFARMPEQELRETFLRCDRAATERVLGFEDGAMCAMAWDEIVRRLYAGDVDGVLAWWRANRVRGGAHAVRDR